MPNKSETKETTVTEQKKEEKSTKKKKKKKRKLIHDIRDWYIGIVDSKCAAPNSSCVWSPLLYGFYELDNSASQPLENYCSLTELESLCKLIGPSGVRVLDLEVLNIGHAAMQNTKGVLEKNRDLIGGVDMHKLHSFAQWHSIVKRFNGLDIIAQQGVIVCCTWSKCIGL